MTGLRRFLAPVNRDDVRAGLMAGGVAGAAGVGALVAIGMRTGMAARPFNVIAATLLGPAAAGTFGFVPGVTLPGIVIELVVILVMGIAAVTISRRWAPAWIACISVTVIAALVSIGVARRGGASLAALLSLGDLAVYHLTLGLALAIGIRLALVDADGDRALHSRSM